jgi:carbon storage regulator
MLVLTRIKDETIKIGKDIEVRIVRIKGGRVEVGVTAPKAVHVLRGELKRKEAA